MQLFTRITRLTLFAIHHLPHTSLTPSHTQLLSHRPSHTTFHLIQFYTLYSIHCKILYLILLYQYYNIVNTCNHIVTIMADMRYNYLNKYNHIDIITKTRINNRNGYLSNIYIE